MKKVALGLTALLFPAIADASSALASSRLARGVNLWEWFATGAPGEKGVPDHAVRREKIGPRDVEAIRGAGFTNVRLGINPYALLPSPLPSGASDFGPCARLRDREFLQDLEAAIREFSDAGIAVVINVRFEGPAKERMRADEPFAIRCLGAFWTALAVESSRKFTPDEVLFDLVNEPDIITTMPRDPDKWRKSAVRFSTIQAQWITQIRSKVSTDYTLILSADGWDTGEGLTHMDAPAGPNLIMTFHYYRNEVFTHQGQPWYNRFVGGIFGLAYPPDEVTCRSNLDATQSEANNLWRGQLQDYCSGKWAMEKDLVAVADWSGDHGHAPVWVGEFGALAGAPLKSRIRWQRDAIAAFRKFGFIGYDTVDYSDPIGCNRLYDHVCADVGEAQ